MQHATALGEILARHSVTVVYGGGKKGLMGCVADSAMNLGGNVRGVIPQLLVQLEQQHDSVTELFVVEDMHQRKRMLYELCDGAVILPGGFGTLDEMFEIITWNQLTIHDKPLFLLNSGGFYDHLLSHIRRMKEDNFLYVDLPDCFTLLSTPEEIEEFL